MTTSERKQAILGVLSEDHRVHAGALAARFGVSEDTIRRDLRSLADEGKIRRVYGGAVPHTPVGDSYTKRITESVASKAAIARLAIPFFKPGQTIFFDAG